jgi:dihydroxyacetone kinase-like predicted kinase
VPQGLAALLNFLPHGPTGDLESVRAGMEQALTSVESGEVTTASRSVELDGVAVAEGQIIGLHNGKLAVAGSDVAAVTLQLLEKMGAAELGAVSLYYGADVSAGAAAALGAQVCAAYPNLEDAVDVLPGGQPYYHYIIAAE